MQIAVTHRNTDFDALSSLIAATLIYPGTVAVCAKNVNPNVHRFLSLHKTAFDLILARNVLIYFDDETKKEFYRKCASALEPHGVLVLGSSETPLFLAPEFGPLTDSPAVGYRLGHSVPQGKGAA